MSSERSKLKLISPGDRSQNKYRLNSSFHILQGFALLKVLSAPLRRMVLLREWKQSHIWYNLGKINDSIIVVDLLVGSSILGFRRCRSSISITDYAAPLPIILSSIFCGGYKRRGYKSHLFIPHLLLMLWSSIRCVNSSKCEGSRERDWDDAELSSMFYWLIFAQNPSSFSCHAYSFIHRFGLMETKVFGTALEVLAFRQMNKPRV